MEVPVAEKIAWQEATVTAIVEQTPTVKSFFLKPPVWPPFMAGQHVDVRLTAPDGYQAQRSYSIASPPEKMDSIEIVVERLDDGEVSPFFHDVVAVGDRIEMRGPIGGHFTWSAADGGPILLVGGGSGVAPLVSMLRHRALAAPDTQMVLIYSARRWSDVIFREELIKRDDSEAAFALMLTLTRETTPMPWHRTGRLDRALVADALGLFAGAVPRRTFVCGATAFVEVAAMFLIEAGLPFASIRTERYGGAPPPSLDAETIAPEV